MYLRRDASGTALWAEAAGAGAFAARWRAGVFEGGQALAWDVAAADRYAEIRHQLMTGGQPIGEMDMMIAAHALARSAVLVINNTRHFQRIAAPLMIVTWVVA